MTDTSDGHAELRRVAAVLEAWAENVRAATGNGNGAQRTERNTAMADVLATAAAALRASPSDNGLAAAICAANAIRADGVPRGFDLAQVYTDGREVVVCGEPATNDETHDCERMGCGAYAHVIYRMTCDEVDGLEKTDEWTRTGGSYEPLAPEQMAEPEGGAIRDPWNSAH